VYNTRNNKTFTKRFFFKFFVLHVTTAYNCGSFRYPRRSSIQKS